MVIGGSIAVACSASPTGVVSVPASSVTVPVGADFTLAVGQSAIVNDGETTIALSKVIGDSRCPTNALILCFWAGSVQLGLTLTEAGATRSAMIETVSTRDVVPLAKYRLQLVSVSPDRLTTDSIPVAQYRGVFRVLRK